jgi:dTDP-glucose pyrophosphorylase
VSFAIQERPLGTADAVLAAESFVGDDRFLVMNADNYYPVAAYSALRDLGEPGLAAFGRDALLADGHIASERIMKFALLDIDADGYLRRIIEKPDVEAARAMGSIARVSMNLWCFDTGIFEPCRTVAPSSRGELELPVAVQHAIDAYGRRFRAVPIDAPVLDLSSRADIAAVANALASVDVRL